MIQVKKQVWDYHNRYIFTYIDEGEVVGTVDLVIFSESSNIESLYVYPEFRRNNIAKELLSAVLEFSNKEIGYNINLKVMRDNRIAYNLYESFGFKFSCRENEYDWLIKEKE